MVFGLEAEYKPVVNLSAASYNYPPHRLICKEKKYSITLVLGWVVQWFVLLPQSKKVLDFNLLGAVGQFGVCQVFCVRVVTV